MIYDAHGYPLGDGDSIIFIKDVRVAGSEHVIRGGTRVDDIHLVPGEQPVMCHVRGVGDIMVKPAFVIRVTDSH